MTDYFFVSPLFLDTFDVSFKKLLPLTEEFMFDFCDDGSFELLNEFCWEILVALVC